MKRKIGLLTTLVLVLICVFALADVEINEENFPDAAFRNVATKYDTDKDGMLSDAEIGEVIEIDCSEMGITTLQGIEYFSALENLRCYFNQLTSLDFSGNTALVLIECYSNQLTSLDISKNMALVAVNVTVDLMKVMEV